MSHLLSTIKIHKIQQDTSSVEWDWFLQSWLILSTNAGEIAVRNCAEFAWYAVSSAIPPTPRWTICWATMALHWKRLTRQTGNDNAVGLTLMTKSKNSIDPRKMTSHHMTPHPSFFLFYALLRDNSWLSSWGNHSHLTIQVGARFPSIECWSDISRHTKSCHLKHLLSSLFLVQFFLRSW